MHAPRCFPRSLNGRQQQRHEDADDRDHDEQLHQRETRALAMLAWTMVDERVSIAKYSTAKSDVLRTRSRAAACEDYATSPEKLRLRRGTSRPAHLHSSLLPRRSILFDFDGDEKRISTVESLRNAQALHDSRN